MAEAGIYDCETQRTEICNLLNNPIQTGDTWYLIDTKWFKQWKKYCGYDSWDVTCMGDESSFPGPIDNSALFKDMNSNIIKDNLIDDLDYVLVPKSAWNKLVCWCGIMQGQPSIARTVIEQGLFVKHCKVEVYLMELKLCHNNDLQKVITQQFSKADTIDDLEKKMRELFETQPDKDVRLWDKYMSNAYEHLNTPEKTIQDVGLYHGQMIVIEEMNEDGTWPRQTKVTPTVFGAQGSSSSAANITNRDNYNSSPARTSSNYYTYSGGYGGANSFDGYRSSSSPGLCGLSNLGNTCFMNSTLQCLSNVAPLTEYFMSNKWRNELNVDNPLGMHGQIASTYAELVRNIWSGKYRYTMPRSFKSAVGRFAPQFSGYQQQDSQELMAFVLDGLHEDLNRIHVKPYIEQKDADGRPDQEIAKEAWQNYLKRNDSIIVDTFHGLLKSTLICPVCSKISVTFDPFCYLSLPLPMKKERWIHVFLVPLDCAKHVKRFQLAVPKSGVISDLCKKLSEKTGIPQEKMVVTDVYNHRFHKVFLLDEALTHILEKDEICVYEVPVSSSTDPDTLILPVYMRQQKQRHKYGHMPQLFGRPLLVPIPRNSCTYEVLYNCVLARLQKCVNVPDDNDDWWRNGTHHNMMQSNGEMDMNGDDDDDEDEEDEMNSEQNSNETSKKLFTFQLVNCHGNPNVNSDMDCIKNDGNPIKFSHRSYVALDWHPKAKSRFFDVQASEYVELDESVTTRKTQRKVIQLTHCLEIFTTREQLGEDDPWYCPRCRKHQQATKKFDLWQLPQILVIHLKRFAYSKCGRDKLDSTIEYPTSGLNMKNYIISPDHGPCIYDLIAVSNHYGGLGGGHYTAFAQNKDDSQWYHFDDSSVSQTTADNVVTSAGYVLVYERRQPGEVNTEQSEQQMEPLLTSTHHMTPPSSSFSSPAATVGSSLSDMDVN